MGTGLIGGSAGLALTSEGASVSGFDPDEGVRQAALARGAVAQIFERPEAVVAGAEVVLMAMPLDRFGPTLESIADHVGPETVVTDVGSAKAAVVRAGEALLGGRFVGGHPMAGSERQGIEAADAALFDQAWWLITPTTETSPDAYSAVAALATAVGARPVALTPGVHDALVARLSHLPQLLASVLVEVANASSEEALLGLAAGGFRDVTRIAASAPDLWVEILRANKQAVLGAVEGFQTELSGVAQMIEDDDWAGLGRFLGEARRARLELFRKQGLPEESVVLSMTVPDRPGVLAEVTTVAGRLGANIEDIAIFHSTEGGRGRLELVVGRDDMTLALEEALLELGYRVHESDS